MNPTLNHTLERGNRIWPGIVLAAATFIVLFLLQGHLNIDRMQENIYLGVPYLSLSYGTVQIGPNDPYEENGPHSVLLPAFILKLTHQLRAIRIYFSLTIILFLLMLCSLTFKRMKSALFQSSFGPWLLAVMGLSVWISIPLAPAYALQTNGMTIGSVFVVAGLMSIEKRPALAAFLFGLASFSKGQFLAFFPAIIVYMFFVVRRGQPWLMRLRGAVMDAFLYFLPHLAFSYIGMMTNLFGTSVDLVGYATLPMRIVGQQLLGIFGRFFGFGATAGGDARTLGSGISLGMTFTQRLAVTEFKTYGALSWALIIFTFGMCAFSAGYAFWSSLRKQKVDLVDGAIGFMGFPYLLNFLFFWAYPYWYNILAVLPFSIYFLARILDYVFYRSIERPLPSLTTAVRSALTICFLLLFVNRFRFYHPFNSLDNGNALKPYNWMTNGGTIRDICNNPMP